MDTDQLRLAVAREASAAAHALTLKNMRRKTIPLGQIAADVTKAAEERTEHLFAMSQLGQVACGPDCAYCCYVPRVLVTLPELARILEQVQSWPTDRIAALKTRLTAHVQAQPDVAPPGARPPCALLIEQRCSVYDVRPLVCRVQHAYDVRECKTHCDTGISETTQLTVVLDTARGAISGVIAALEEMGTRVGVLDLSRALLLALDSPKVIAQAASGFPSLASAAVTDDIE
jgi:Fe-S-cluster containining protein